MKHFFVPRMIGPVDFRPSPAPHLKTFREFLFYFPNGPIFSTMQNYTPNAALY
jgi:hypothetical protein